jgi:endonuclease YncB( thermonuclease family)
VSRASISRALFGWALLCASGASAAGFEDLVVPFHANVHAVLAERSQLPAVVSVQGRTVAPTAGPRYNPGDTFSGKVTLVSDADTLYVRHGSKDVDIRLEAVDAPEVAHPQYNKPGQPYGEEAKQFVRSLCEGKTVQVRVAQMDSYGRVIGWITLPDGRSLQEELLRNGWAWWNFYYNHDQALNALENEALKAGRGLWAGRALGGEYAPEAPWVFRRRIEAGMGRVLPGQELEFQVHHMPDGDTVALGTRNGVYDYIRLAAVDAPEVSHQGKPAQPYGAEAGARASQLVQAEGMRVTVKVEDVDSYGRIIGWVWLKSRIQWLNTALVEEGWAWWYKSYYPQLTELGQMQERARAARRGLWADPNPIPPWQFRQDHR